MMIFRAVASNVAKLAAAGALGLYTMNKPAFYSAQIYIADNAIMPIMRKIDPETAHELAIAIANYSPKDPTPDDPILSQRLWGLPFANPIGLAAGFDKNGLAIGGMLDLGFAFVEVGSVTPRPQPGNPKPRVFRLQEDGGVINRYGFNSDGGDRVLANMRSFRDCRQKHRRGFVGINAGKNKETSEEEAKNDYCDIISKIGPEADYIVVNVSSPNTPGLRRLQEKGHLGDLVAHCLTARDAVREGFGGQRASEAGMESGDKGTAPPLPLFIKIAPDLSYEDRQDVAAICIKYKVDGIIASNTTISRPAYLLSEFKSEAGGLSGKPVQALSTQLVADMFHLTHGQIPIIGAGGVGDGASAFEKVISGASLVQIYTMMSLNGPGTVKKTKSELAQLLRAHGFSNIQEAVGSRNSAYRTKRD